MRGKRILLLPLTMIFFLPGAIATTATTADDVPKVTTQELKGQLGDPDVVIVDVRTEGSWKGSASKIKGAVREDPKNVQNWIKKYPKEKTLVFYCS